MNTDPQDTAATALLATAPDDLVPVGEPVHMSMPTTNSNIQVEITDAHEFHCFRLVLNPKGHDPCCPAAMLSEAPCSCRAEGGGVRIEIMLHGRSLVDLIHKCSVALCEWQAQTTDYLLERLTGKRP